MLRRLLGISLVVVVSLSVNFCSAGDRLKAVQKQQAQSWSQQYQANQASKDRAAQQRVTRSLYWQQRPRTYYVQPAPAYGWWIYGF